MSRSECADADCEAQDGGPIQQRIRPRAKDLGGFSVRRLLPSASCRSVGPWVFFDHMGPAEFGPGPGINVRPHPHIHLATVSYLFEGEMWHRDSLGSDQRIRPGDINLMVAGRGIVHSERERPEAMAQARRMNGLQLWLALPAEQEDIAPAFHHYPAADIPATEVEGVPLRVLMGAAYGLQSPVRTFAQTLYVEASLQAGQALTLPAAPERALYVAQGQLQLEEHQLDGYDMALLCPEQTVRIVATAPTRVALIGGEALGHRHMDWNFVSSRAEAITKAKADWAAGRFPLVPGDEEEFIPYPSRPANA